MQALIIFSRIFVGLLFIVSGLIKANDSTGFSYKLIEYFEVFGISWLDSFALSVAVAISVSEIVLGVAVIFGSKIKAVAWSLLSLILFFTFLTFYSAYFNKVTDCGCFGDALKGVFGRSLTPWESFVKDIVLLFFILIIFLFKARIKPLIKAESINSVVLVLTTIFSFWFSFHCINHLPVKDFRPYAIGKSIIEQMTIPEGAPKDVYKNTLIYKNMNTSEVKEFDESNYPWNDSNWVWQDTKNKLIKKGYEPKIHDFKITDFEGNDYTQDFLNDPDYLFVWISYDISKTNKAAHLQFNDFADQCYKNGVSIIGLTASSYDLTENFRHEVQSMIDFYNVDEITLKTIIRSNPGLVLLKQGVVINKWHYNDLPKLEEALPK